MKTKNKTILAIATFAAMMMGVAAIATGGATAVLADEESPAYTFQPVNADVNGSDPLMPYGSYAGIFESGGLGWTYFSSDFRIGGFSEDEGVAIYGPSFQVFSEQTVSFTLFSEAFMALGGETLISRVDVSGSFNDDESGVFFTDVSLQVYVNGGLVGTESLTYLPTTYRFDLVQPAYGSVEIVFSGILNDFAECDPVFNFVGVDVYAETTETGTAIVPAIQDLEEIKTCDIAGGSSAMQSYLSNHGAIVSNEVSLSDILIRDYAPGDTEYTGYREIRIPFMDKFYACLERYYGYSVVSSLADFSDGGEATIAAACIMLAAVTIGAAVYVIIRKRREA